MAKCMGRHLRYQAWVGLQYFASLLLVIGMFLCIQLFTVDFSDMSVLSVGMFSYAQLGLLFVGVIIGTTDKTVYSRAYMSFCCTRRAAFWGNQIMKVLYQLLSVALIFMISFLLDVAVGGEMRGQLLTAPSFLILWTVGIMTQSMGEFIGDLSLRFGKWGFAFYIILCAGFGGVIGFMAVSEQTGMQWLMGAIWKTPLWLAPLMLGVAALFTAVSGLLGRKTTIKA